MARGTRDLTTGGELREIAETPGGSGRTAIGERAEPAASRAAADGRARPAADPDRADAPGDSEAGAADAEDSGAGSSGAGGGETGRSESAPGAPTAIRTGRATPSGPVRRFVARTALVLGVLATVMAGTLLGACAINDHAIAESQGKAVAEVVDTSPVRAAVRFTTDDGRVYIPAAGVLYPSGLKPGQLVRVEYNKRNPNLVRVADRTAAVALLPVGSALAGTWVVLGAVYLAARRK